MLKREKLERDVVEDLYCADNGRPSTDPVVLIKMALIQHLYGIRSLRQTVRDIEMNIAYRWFLGYTLNETIPHFATVSYNFRHRFKEPVIEDIFTWILYELERAGYLKPEVVFVDATHIKANANLKKRIKKRFRERLERMKTNCWKKSMPIEKIMGKSHLMVQNHRKTGM
jgi:transposase